jgi:hypothetical protein
MHIVLVQCDGHCIHAECRKGLQTSCHNQTLFVLFLVKLFLSTCVEKKRAYTNSRKFFRIESNVNKAFHEFFFYTFYLFIFEELQISFRINLYKFLSHEFKNDKKDLSVCIK